MATRLGAQTAAAARIHRDPSDAPWRDSLRSVEEDAIELVRARTKISRQAGLTLALLVLIPTAASGGGSDAAAERGCAGERSSGVGHPGRYPRGAAPAQALARARGRDRPGVTHHRLRRRTPCCGCCSC